MLPSHFSGKYCCVILFEREIRCASKLAGVASVEKGEKYIIKKKKKEYM